MTFEEKEEGWRQILARYSQLRDYDYLTSELKKLLTLPHIIGDFSYKKLTGLDDLIIELVADLSEEELTKLINRNMHILVTHVVILKIWECLLKKSSNDITVAALRYGSINHWEILVKYNKKKQYINNAGGNFSIDIFSFIQESELRWAENTVGDYGNIMFDIEFWACVTDDWRVGIDNKDSDKSITKRVKLEEFTRDWFMKTLDSVANTWAK